MPAGHDPRASSPVAPTCVSGGVLCQGAEMATSEPTFVRQRPGLLLRLGFKVPRYLYRGPLAELLRTRCVLLLTTTGRKSGLPRTTGVSFMPMDDHYVVFSGFGVRSNWYRNLRANPEVIVQVGRRRWRATAQPVLDPARRRDLMLRMQQRSRNCGPPTFIRPLLRLSRTFDYDAEIRMAVEHANELPVIEIVPHDPL